MGSAQPWPSGAGMVTAQADPARFEAGSIASMQAYYAARAAEYERVYLKPGRQAELRRLEAEMPGWFAERDGLEVACGTGWWTPHAARQARSWCATDVNPQTLALAAAKPLPGCVRLHTVDAYSWAGLPAPAGGFTAAFAGCWWSHLPRQRLPQWLQGLHQWLAPGACVVFLDNRWVEGDSTPLSRQDRHGNTYQQRRLDDGSWHEVLKNYPTAAEALACLGPRARHVQWQEHPHYWVLRYELA